jgi:hypothetical protein
MVYYVNQRAMKSMIKLSVVTAIIVSAFPVVMMGQVNYGTMVAARLMSELESETDQFTNADLVVASDVYANGELYIRKGTEILNNVSLTGKSGVGKPGVIEINAVSTVNVDNETVPLNGTFRLEGESNRGKALGVGLGVGLGTFLLPMLGYLAKKGEPAVISANTVLNEFFIAQ